VEKSANRSFFRQFSGKEKNTFPPFPDTAFIGREMTDTKAMM